MKIKLLRCGVFALMALGAIGGTQARDAVTYENTIKAITGKRCVACHGPDSPTLSEFDTDKQGYAQKLKGPRMDSYESIMVFVNGSDAGALMRRLDDGTHTKDRRPGNMYANLGESDTERARNLELFKRWVGYWTLKRDTELSVAERKAIAAPRN